MPSREDAQAVKARRIAQSKAERLAYKKAKAKIFEFEKKNRNRIIMVKNGNWYKIGGNSLIFYMNFVAKRLKLKVEPKRDTDFHSVFEDGVWSLKNLDEVEARMKKVKIYLAKSDVMWRSYDLGHVVSDEELQRMQEEVRLKRDRLNKVVMPKSSYPDLYARLRYITKILAEKLRKVDEATRQVMGVEASRKAIRLIQNYVLMTNGSFNKELFFKECIATGEWLMAWLLVMEDLRVMDLNTCLRMGEDIEAMMVMARRGLDE